MSPVVTKSTSKTRAKKSTPVTKSKKEIKPKEAEVEQKTVVDSDSETETSAKFALDKKQVTRAVAALKAFLSKKSQEESGATKKSLLDDESGSDDEQFWLVVTTKTLPKTLRVKPIRMQVLFFILISSPLTHPIYDIEKTEVCLITKDPQRTYKDLVQAKNLSFVKKACISIPYSDVKVVGISKLKLKFKPYEAKRQLCSSYNLFMADERILPMLPKALGKVFFTKKRHPVPVDITKGDRLQQELESALKSTFLNLNKGCCNSIRIGLQRHSTTEIVDNIMNAIDPIVEKLPKKWPNIQSIHIKTTTSTSLPVYSCMPSEE